MDVLVFSKTRQTVQHLLFIFIALLLLPTDLYAIHAIFKGVSPIPREHGPLKLDMGRDNFLQFSKSKEVPKVIGQFSDEHQYEFDPSVFSKDVEKVISDFYKDRLFRIEINYKSMSKKIAPVQAIIDQNTQLHGPPRINTLTGLRLIFWDDGATRLIMQIDENNAQLTYSLTYIDDDLFHQASRDRVQREIGGRSFYGK